MECPICFEESEDISLVYTCNVCTKTFCLRCFDALSKESCPFCRTAFTSFTSLDNTSSSGCQVPTIERQQMFSTSVPGNFQRHEHAMDNLFYSHSYDMNYASSSLSMRPHTEYSRTMTRQIRRERKRIEHENQKIRNAQLSRIHNRQSKQQSRQERRNELLFDFEIGT